MKFARVVFIGGGVWGIVILTVVCFLLDSPTYGVGGKGHSELAYGFVAVAMAWQVAFLVIGSDVRRFRPMMIPAMLEKIGFPVAVLLLYLQGRVAPTIFIPASLDLVLLFLFIAAYQKTPAVDSSRS